VLTTIKKAVYLLNRDGLYRWFVILAVGFVAAVFEMAGAVLVFLVVSLATSPNQQIDVPIIGNVRSLAPNLDYQSFLLWLLAAIALLFTVRGAVQVGAGYIRQRVAHNTGARISGDIVEGYLMSAYPLYLKRDSAELIRNSHYAVLALVNQLFLPLILIAVETLIVLGILIVLVAVAPLVTIIAALSIGVLGWAVLMVVQPRLHALGRTTHEMQRETLRTLQESFHGIRDVKALSVERFFSRKYRRYRFKLARALYMTAPVRQLPRVIVETGLIFLILVLLAIASSSDAQATNAVSLVGLFAYAGMRLLPSVQKLIAGFNSIRFSSAPLDDIHADLIAAEQLPSHRANVDPLPFDSELLMNHITFRYDGADDCALTDIVLSIKPGEFIGICGPTGGGKTTMIDILIGFLEPTSGCVTVDGIDLHTHHGEWLRTLGVVPQMGFLTDDTLLRNIALGIPDDRIDHEAVDEAIELAQLKSYVESLPDGLETLVGERGIRISGGQRQRIAIARALYRRPTVLMFDEGTSALDSATEARLMASIETLRGSHTIVVVAHRLSTIRNSDRIVYLRGGQMQGLGTYDHLMDTNSDFRAFATPK